MWSHAVRTVAFAQIKSVWTGRIWIKSTSIAHFEWWLFEGSCKRVSMERLYRGAFVNMSLVLTLACLARSCLSSIQPRSKFRLAAYTQSRRSSKLELDSFKNLIKTYGRRLIEQTDPVGLITGIVGVWRGFKHPIKLKETLFEHDRFERIVEQFNIGVDCEPDMQVGKLIASIELRIKWTRRVWKAINSFSTAIQQAADRHKQQGNSNWFRHSAVSVSTVLWMMRCGDAMRSADVARRAADWNSPWNVWVRLTGADCRFGFISKYCFVEKNFFYSWTKSPQRKVMDSTNHGQRKSSSS